MGFGAGRQGKPREAEVRFREALRLQPTNSNVRVDLGTVLQDQGKIEEALHCYGDALQLEPDHPGAATTSPGSAQRAAIPGSATAPRP